MISYEAAWCTAVGHRSSEVDRTRPREMGVICSSAVSLPENVIFWTRCHILRISGEVKERARRYEWRAAVFIIYSKDREDCLSPSLVDDAEENRFYTTALS